jgi:integrase
MWLNEIGIEIGYARPSHYTGQLKRRDQIAAHAATLPLIPDVPGIDGPSVPASTEGAAGEIKTESQRSPTPNDPLANIRERNRPLAVPRSQKAARKNSMVASRESIAPLSTSCHTFRATGITAYLENGSTIEHAQAIANHESPRTTKLYDRTSDAISLDEGKRIAI